MNVGVAIQAARERAGLLQSDLAKKAKIDRSYLSQLENNKKSPTLDVYFRICAALGIRPTTLMAVIEAG